ncbi:unnamed protein product, partial [Didymodactylos carnosus]
MAYTTYEKVQMTDDQSNINVVTNINNPTTSIRHYFVFSLISSIFLCPASGIIALAYSLKSSAKADAKCLDKARLYSRRAKIWNLIPVALYVLKTLDEFLMYRMLPSTCPNIANTSQVFVYLQFSASTST